MPLTLFLLVIAFGLSIYALIESKGRGVLQWAIALIATALILPQLRAIF